MYKQTKAKRIITSFIGFALVLFIPVMSLIEGIGLKQHKSDVHEKILQQEIAQNSQLLDSLYFESSDYHKFAYQDEIEWNGNMYDIVSIKPVAGGFMVFAFNDSLENELKKSIALSALENDESSSSTPSKANYLKLQWFRETNEVEQTTCLISAQTYAQWINEYSLTVTKSFFHPPQLQS